MKGKFIRLLLFFMITAVSQKMMAQDITITGERYTEAGFVNTYNVNFYYSPNPIATITFEVTGGTIVAQNVIPTGDVSCTVRWDLGVDTGYVYVHDDYAGKSTTLEIYIGTPLLPGEIYSPFPYYNKVNDEAVIGNVTAIGGYCQENFTYTWEHSTDGINWIAVGNTPGYPPTAPLITQRTFIRRKVICGVHTGYTNVLEFTYRSENWENRNYIRTSEIWYPGVNSLQEADALPIGQRQQNTVYYDGLGRTDQTVIMQGSPDRKDLATPVVYDPLGRETKKYLAYQAVTDDGRYKPNALIDQATFMGDPVTGKYAGESHFYAETILENSPLNRAVKMIAPGQSWGGNGKGINTDYDLNNTEDKVRIWRINPFAVGAIPVSNSTDIFPAYTIFKTTTTDERGRKIIDYIDNDGRTILKKQQEKEEGPLLTGSHKGWLCTYYVYDDLGRLRFTITPKAVAQMDLADNWTISQQMADGLCYTNSFDSKGRLIEKKLPDASPVRLVYDARDRVVLAQDGNQAAGKTNTGNFREWSFYVYDDLDREVADGVLWENSNHTRSSLQTSVNTLSITGNANVTVQTNISESILANRPVPIFPGVSSLITYQQIRVNNTTYYDGENASQFTNIQLGYANNFENIEAAQPSNRNKNLQTGSKTRVLDATGAFLVASTIYDDKGRVLQTRSKNVQGWDLTLTNQYDFSGKVRSSKFTDYHQESYTTPVPGVADQIIDILSKNEFDHVGRLKKSYKNYRRKGGVPPAAVRDFNTGDKLVAEFEYDELGQIKTKTLAPGYDGPNGPWMEKLNYSHNIRGWITGINKDYVKSVSQSGSFFGLELGYDKAGDAGFTNSILNGNVTGVAWKTAGDNAPRKYDFEYDIANRLIKADFKQRNGFSNPGSWAKDKYDFSVPKIEYDPNGNITRLEHKGVSFSGIVPMDMLTYSYGANSNQLQWVAEDAGATDYKLSDFTDRNAGQNNTDYSYDNNGNVSQDKNKGIASIKYNYLNLPELVVFTGKGTIEYVYDAAGNKLKKIVTDNTPVTGTTTKNTVYSGPVVYDDNSIAVGFEEGRVRLASVADPDHFVFDYYVKDHLGNVRMVLTEETSTVSYMPATMEVAATLLEEKYYTITDRSDLPVELRNNSSYADRYGQKMSQLSSLGSGKKVGPSILLKVMSGDVFRAKTDYYYKDNGTQTNSNTLLNDLATNLLLHLALGQAGSAAKAEAAAIGSNTAGDNVVQGLITQQNNSYVNSKPKAYLNYILFDEQMNAVSTGFLQVAANGPLQPSLILPEIEVNKNGWIYVFTNNESQQSVYFDNLQVVHGHGNILEETHYYPFGLTMKAISPRALAIDPINRNKYNGKELQSEEFADGGSFEMYDYGARLYDPQIGRWHALDPMAEEFLNISPYSYGANNPVIYKDKDGKFINFILQYGVNVGLNIATQMLTAYMFDPSVKGWGDAWDKVSVWQAVWEGGVDMVGNKKIQMALNGVTQMFTYIDQVGLKNVTSKGLIGAGLIGVLEPIVGDAIAKYGISTVTKGLQKIGLDPKTVARLMGQKFLPKIEISGKRFPTGSWVLEQAKKYQAKFSGDADLSFNLNGVSFDAVKKDKLIDTKFGHANAVFDPETLDVVNKNRSKSLLEQAQRQKGAIDGTDYKIEWHISTELGANGIRKLFEENNVDWIKVIHTPF